MKLTTQEVRDLVAAAAGIASDAYGLSPQHREAQVLETLEAFDVWHESQVESKPVTDYYGESRWLRAGQKIELIGPGWRDWHKLPGEPPERDRNWEGRIGTVTSFDSDGDPNFTLDGFPDCNSVAYGSEVGWIIPGTKGDDDDDDDYF